MKQYVDKIREENKKSSAPRCRTPESGSGSIKTPHGTELIRYSKPQGIKNARSIKWRAISPDSNVRHCKYEDLFWNGKKRE